MKKNTEKPLRSAFLLAAEGVFIAHTVGDHSIMNIKDKNVRCSLWCCNILSSLVGCHSPEYKMFEKYFEQKDIAVGGGWWDMYDCESRLIALLLCAEMLRR